MRSADITRPPVGVLASEKRESLRTMTWRRATLVPSSGDRVGEEIPVFVCDYSATGIGLLTNDMIAVGTTFELKLSSSGDAIAPLYVVQRHSTLENGRLLLGAMLMSMGSGACVDASDDEAAERLRDTILNLHTIFAPSTTSQSA